MLLAGLVCTTTSVNRNNDRYIFVRNVLKIYFINYYQLVNKSPLHSAC